jgi:hypothetical protein
MSTPRSRAIDGIAMFTMLMFMTDSHMPVDTTTSASHRPRGCASIRTRTVRACVLARALTTGV